MATDTDVRCRIARADKDAASEVFDRMGITMSDGIRMFLRRVAEEQAIPFEVRVPNRETAAAIDEARRGEPRAHDPFQKGLQARAKAAAQRLR
jgi:DNA-damage-inducible protein J